MNGSKEMKWSVKLLIAVGVLLLMGTLIWAATIMMPKLGDYLDEGFEMVREMQDKEFIDNFVYVSDASYVVIDKKTKKLKNPFNEKSDYYYYFLLLIDGNPYEFEVPLNVYQTHKVDETIQLKTGVDNRYFLTIDGQSVVKETGS